MFELFRQRTADTGVPGNTPRRIPVPELAQTYLADAPCIEGELLFCFEYEPDEPDPLAFMQAWTTR